jgi:hypothetical protein
VTSELSDKTWGLQTRSFGVIWLTEEEAKRCQLLLHQGAESLEFEDVTVMKGDISGFATGERLRSVERKKKGDWECDYGYWHERNDKCAHHMVPGARRTR